jgi:hypothetical protein
MTIYTVALEDGTVGTVDSDTIDASAHEFIGQVLNVHLRDENGEPIEVEGVVSEILDEREAWN